ncbi:MAG TPA: hypothetical protein VHZ95_09845, partial [Polyangiales bacterium]|nr:hypothetical protein [Polyangiales bacterium]
MSGERARDHGRRSTSASFALYLAFALALVCALSLSFLPRAIPPNELPALTLSATDVEAQLREDADRAAHAPTSDNARELDRLFLEFGASEIAAIEDSALATQRRRTLHHAYERIVAADGGEAALALRERALQNFERALALQLPPAETVRVIGLFANAVEQHRLTRDGEELAPHFVMRTLYKARWNRMTGLPLDHEFSRIERIAYYGWMGLS